MTKTKTTTVKLSFVALAMVVVAVATLLIAATVAMVGTTGVQTAAAIGDVNENSATEFAPGILNQFSKEEPSASDLAPRAFSDPTQIGDPNSIGDPHVRAPGLVKQAEEFPGPG